MREPLRSRQLRLLSVTIAAILLAATAACGGGSKALPASPGASGTGQTLGETPDSLAAALKIIRQEEADARSGKLGKQTLALPDTLLGDADWFSGPAGAFTKDSVAHTMRLQSSTSDPSSPNNLAYSIYRLENHGGDPVQQLALNAVYTSGQYWVYVVDYASTPVWHQFGPFSSAAAGPGWPLDLSGISPVSLTNRVYVAVVASGVSDITVDSLTVQESTAPPPTYFETEPNDTFEQANPLPPFDFNLTDVMGHVGGADPADWFSFNAATAGRVYLTLVLPEATGDLDLQLYDTDGGTLLDASNGGPTEKGERVQFDISAAGKYYVRIYPANGGAGDYQLWGTYADVGENVSYETEPNDTKATANALPQLPLPNPTIIGTASTTDTDDCYSFQVFEQSVITVTMYTDFDNPAQKLELIATDGTTTLSSDDSGGAFYQVVAVVEAGIYYVHVQELSGNFDYELRAELSQFNPDGFFEVEPNNDSSTATPFPAFNFKAIDVTGDVGMGGFYDSSPDDWFSFNVTQPGTVKLLLQRSYGVGDPLIELFDTDGATLLANSITGFIPESISYYFPAAGGPYFLHVGVSNFTWLEYGITGRFHAGVDSYFEVEDNDDAAHATPFPAFPFSNNAVTGNLGIEGDYNQDEHDWYSFAASGPGTVTLIMYIDSIGADLDLGLYDTDGVTKLGESVETGPVERIDCFVPAAGTYFLHSYVWVNSHDASNYSIDGYFTP